ncbi:hypothetical protein ACLOAV_010405 [Pseudogymnoascus australis]
MDEEHRELRGLLLDPGPSPEVSRFIKQRRLGLSLILEETFRRVDLGPRDLVCRQGAFFEKGSLEIDGSYKSIQLVVLYAQSEPNDDSLWSEFEPCDSRDTTEDTLDELIDILYAASTFEMADLFGAVERHIIIHGEDFIYVKNAQEIKAIANKFANRAADEYLASNGISTASSSCSYVRRRFRDTQTGNPISHSQNFRSVQRL